MSKSATGKKKMPFLVVTAMWLGKHRASVVECFIKTESYVAVQCAFHKKF